MAWPTSKTSGAASVPLLVLAASSSSLDEAFGLSSVTLIFRVLLLEALDDLAVVGPVVRKGDDVQRALFLGGLLEVFHGAEVGEGGGFGGLFVHGDGLAGAFAGAIGGGVARAAGGHREREHGGEGAGRDLTQVVHNVPFLNIIQTTVWGVGLGMRGIRAARESKKRNYAPNLS